MKPTQEQVIAWAREAHYYTDYEDGKDNKQFKVWAFTEEGLQIAFAIAYEAGRESMKWDGIHTCHDQCQRPACVARRNAYKEGYEAGRKDENEACAKVCEDMVRKGYWITKEEAAAHIRARREQ